MTHWSEMKTSELDDIKRAPGTHYVETGANNNKRRTPDREASVLARHVRHRLRRRIHSPDSQGLRLCLDQSHASYPPDLRGVVNAGPVY